MIRKIPNETPTYHFYNANPKGRRTTDCVVRAICTALEQDYNKTVIELAEMQCATGYDDADDKLYDKYLQSKGWKKFKQPRKWDNTKYIGSEFCRLLDSKNCEYTLPYQNSADTVIAHIGGHHVVCIKIHDNKHKVFDTWNSTRGCIGNYWTK